MITELIKEYKAVYAETKERLEGFTDKMKEIVENTTEEGKYYQMINQERNTKVILRPFYKQSNDAEEWIKYYDVINITVFNDSSEQSYGNSYTTIKRDLNVKNIEPYIKGDLELISESYYNEILQTIKKLDI